LNANALYELGVRHALRPYSTLVISEKELEYPFDINHTVIDSYKHLGDDIGVSEAKRFKKELRDKLKKILEQPNTDSPVYTYLSELSPPKLKRIKRETVLLEGYPSISDLIKDAEQAKNRKDYQLAIEILNAALKYDENNHFILQRLALATYKSEKPNKMASYNKALVILKKLNPEQTTDPETLGLCGAIYKRMFELSKKKDHLKKALCYYERGFYVAQDYYNGINVAFLYDLMASTSTNKEKAICYSIHANEIREKVIKICDALIKNRNFSSRNDAEWIVQTIYQALIGNGKKNGTKKYLGMIKKYSEGDFDQDTFVEHVDKLFKFKDKIRKKFKINV